MHVYTYIQTNIHTYIHTQENCVYMYIHIYIHTKYGAGFAEFIAFRAEDEGRGCIARGLRFRSLLGGRERFHPPHVRVGIVGMAAGESHGCGRGDLDLV